MVSTLSRETYAADEALQQSERNKQEQDRLVLHLEREIEIQKARLAKAQGLVNAEDSKRCKAEQSIQEVVLAIQEAGKEAKGKLLGWKEAVTELHRRDGQLQVCALCTSRETCLNPMYIILLCT